MLQTVVSRFFWTLGLMLLQVVVLNHVNILGYATPMPYVLALLLMPSTLPRWAFVLIGFAMGLVLDIFTTTPGMAAASLCLVGLLVPLFQRLFSDPHSEADTLLPSIHTMGVGGFARYALLASSLHCTCFFLLESFSFFRLDALLINIVGSIALTWVIIMGLAFMKHD